jgi:hypothetical protein
MFRRYQIAIVLAMSIVMPARASGPWPELQSQMEMLAGLIRDATNNQPVRIGAFTPIGFPHSNAGPGIEEALRMALESSQKASVTPTARYEVKGDYFLADSGQSSDAKQIKLVAHIFDTAAGKELTQIDKVRLRAPGTIAAMMAVTGGVSPDANYPERQQAIVKMQQDVPTVYIHGSNNELVSSSQASPYAVEILVRPAGSRERHAARDARNDDGLAYVDIKQDEEYAIKIHNNSGKRIAVAAKIDGVDVLQFAKEKKQNGEPYRYYITANKEMTIVGWLVTKKLSRAFLVTSYGQGAVSEAGLASRGSIGTIHVQISECDEEREQMTLGASANSGEGGHRGNETGFGREVQTNMREVNYQVQEPHDFVTIRYTR